MPLLPLKLSAFRQRQKVIPPNSVSIGLQEFVASRTCAHTDPSGYISFLGVEPMLFVLNEADDVRRAILPATALIGSRPAHTSNMFMWAIAVRPDRR
jgi:hypothetical protein